MERRKAFATAGAVSVTAIVVVVALGANVGLFGLTRHDDGPGRFKLVGSTHQGPEADVRTGGVDAPAPGVPPAGSSVAGSSGAGSSGAGSSGAGSSGGSGESVAPSPTASSAESPDPHVDDSGFDKGIGSDKDSGSDKAGGSESGDHDDD